MQKRTYITILTCLSAVYANANDINENSEKVAHPINEIVVTGTRNTTENRLVPNAVTTIERDQLTEGYSQSIIPAITLHTPGLFSTSRGIIGYGVSTNAAGEIKIRGVGSGADLLMLVDGQPQYAGLFGHPIPDFYNSMLAEKVEVLRGPASVLYGSNAMGGVVNVISRKNRFENGTDFDLNVRGGSYYTHMEELNYHYRNDNITSTGGLSYSHTDGHRDNTAFDGINGYLNGGLEITGNWALKAGANFSHTKSENPGPQSAPLLECDAKVTRYCGTLSLNNDYGFTNGSVRLFLNGGKNKVNDGHKAGEKSKTYLYNHHDMMTGISAYQSIALAEGNRTTLGVDYQHFGGKAYNEDIKTGKRTNLIKDDKGKVTEKRYEDDFAVYAEVRQDLNPAMTVEGGIRMDHHSVTGTQWIPQGSVMFHLPSHQNLKLLVSKGFRNPTLKEMYMFTPSNENLKPQSTLNYELAYTYRPTDHAHFGANLFFIKGKDMIDLIYDKKLGHKIYVNTGEIENYGVELNGTIHVGDHWAIDGNYSYLHTKTKITGAPESKFYAGASFFYRVLSGNIGLQRIDGLYISADEGNNEKEEYTLVNASLSLRCNNMLSLYAKGENLLAQKYQTYEGFYMPRATFMVGLNLRF